MDQGLGIRDWGSGADRAPSDLGTRAPRYQGNDHTDTQVPRCLSALLIPNPWPLAPYPQSLFPHLNAIIPIPEVEPTKVTP